MNRGRGQGQWRRNSAASGSSGGNRPNSTGQGPPSLFSVHNPITGSNRASSVAGRNPNNQNFRPRVDPYVPLTGSGQSSRGGSTSSFSNQSRQESSSSHSNNNASSESDDRQHQSRRNRRHGRNGNQSEHRNTNNFSQSQPDHHTEESTQNQSQRKKFDGPVFGFKRLYNFLNADADDVITNLYRNLNDWEILLNNDSIAANKTLRNGSQEMSDDLLVLIILLLGEKVCSDSTVLSTKQICVVTSAASTLGFLNKIDDKCKRLMLGSGASRRVPNNEMEVDQSPARLLKALNKFFRFVATKMKTTALDFLNKIFPSALGSVHYLNAINPSVELSQLLPDFDELKIMMTNLKTEAERKVRQEEVKNRRRFNDLTAEEEEEIHNMAPPDDYREIPIIPTTAEIFSREESFLRTNRTKGAYTDANHYLDVQYRLLREDFVRPLKKGIQDFMKNKVDYLAKKKRFPIGDIRIYPEVHYAKMNLVRGSMIHFMQLHPSNYQKIKWDKSKRLLTGSLLVFTPDDFSTAYFAVVHQRDENNLKQGLLGVTWEGLQPEFNKENEFLMVECEVYFEAYRHTLHILKEIELEKFPMAKFIVEASSDVGPPKFLLQNRHLYQLGKYSCSPLQDNSWPTADELKLDEKQFAAYKACLTKEFVIVQGPPGTGKTFLALQVVEVLLRNTYAWRPEEEDVGPILVVCYTNHALDQFLEGILDVFKKNGLPPKMIRVGGRSKTEALSEFSLMRQRSIASKMQLFDRNYKRMQAEAYEAVRKSENRRANVMTELMALNNLEGIVDFHSLSLIDELSTEIPATILEAIQKLSWFGLDESFEISNQSDENRLRQWFKLQFAPSKQELIQPTNANVAGASRVQNQNQLISADSDEEMEDYDIEELQRNRVIDEIYAQAETAAPTNIGGGRILKYLFNHLNRTLRQSIDDLDKHKEIVRSLKDTSKIERETKIATLNDKIDEHRRQLKLLERKESFIQTVFTAHKNKMLDLPNVDRYFQNSDVHNFSSTVPAISTRWAIFFQVLERAKKLTAAAVKQADDMMSQAQKALQEVFKYGDGKLLARSTIVGMTTTGAAKYNDLLRMAKSRIVIVEEAAEVLESHIVTCITPTCQQLILIGDHQQLRPSTTVYELATTYHLDISLFERMVNNKLNCYKINVQHRMRPEIANLVVGTIYPELFNATRVYEYPPVTGVISNLFFITHEEAESSESDTKSKSNEHEAKFLTSFCRYLIQQGYTPNQITILTTYTGQMFLIKQLMRKFLTCQGVRVTCVDNFQGEENDIILLSLVRSNSEGNIGFLKTDNRICVAISRAKHGLFIIGNMTKLAKGSKTWRQIEDKLINRSEIGASLTIECQIHGTISDVTKDSDFQRLAPEGGCKNPCGFKLKCNHICDAVCHIQDREHIKHKCKAPCEKFCPKQHRCSEPCFKECPPCPVKVLKTLSCDHQLTLPCHRPEDTVTCHVAVEKELPCGHKETLTCFVDPREYKCKVKVDKNLPCGHVKEMECFVDPASKTCRVNVEKNLPCGHSQQANCWINEESIPCETQVEITFPACNHKTHVKCRDSKKPGMKCKNNCTVRLDCGHACTLICHTDDDPEHLHFICKKPCIGLCPNGEHRCKTGHACHLRCPPCTIRVEKTQDCGHRNEMECGQKQEDILCQRPCSRVLNCGHDCQSICFEPCAPCQVTVRKQRSYCGHNQAMACSENYTGENCEVKVKPLVRSICGHDTKVPCRLARTIKSEGCLEYCESPCGFVFQESNGGCGHRCKGSCSACRQNRIHVKCQEKCGKTLICGHICDFPCSQNCPPCQQGCNSVCGHSKCSAKCGQPCNECAEPCQWKCIHMSCTKICSDRCNREPCTEPCPKKILKCGHECIGFCGEPCPSQCKICHREELVEEFYTGFEDDDDARFVLLEDCGHAIVAEYLDYHMNNEIVEGEIKAKECPRCKTLIRKSLRYGNILKNSLKDVVAVKKKTFGNMQEIEKTHMTLVQRIRNNPFLGNFFPEASHFVLSVLGKEVYLPNGRTRFAPTKVDASRLASLDLIIKHLEDAHNVITKGYKESGIPALKPSLHTDLVDRFTALFDIIIHRKLPFSSIEIQDFDREFERLFDLKQIYLRVSSPAFTTGHTRANLIFVTLQRITVGPQIYSEELKAEVHGLIEELEKILKTGLGISDRERREILAAINLQSGRWFKCPNGHIYLITECGGAMQESICNECGAKIGGGSHQLRRDNALATEMDGATQPLYPNMI